MPKQGKKFNEPHPKKILLLKKMKTRVSTFRKTK